MCPSCVIILSSDRETWSWPSNAPDTCPPLLQEFLDSFVNGSALGIGHAQWVVRYHKSVVFIWLFNVYNSQQQLTTCLQFYTPPHTNPVYSSTTFLLLPPLPPPSPPFANSCSICSQPVHAVSCVPSGTAIELQIRDLGGSRWVWYLLYMYYRPFWSGPSVAFF